MLWLLSALKPYYFDDISLRTYYLFLYRNGDKTIHFHNGQKEIQTAGSKRREYPDGTIKTVYANGQWETKNVAEQVQMQNDKEALILDEWLIPLNGGLTTLLIAVFPKAFCQR